MEKYAKIENEETKQCSVGLGDPDAPFSEIVVPAVTHEEIIPAEYDEDGNLVKEEEVITVIDEEEHTEIITIGDYYESIGMTKMDVEQAYNNQWYVEGYAPEKPEPTHEDIRKQRELRFEQEADPIRYSYDEALARGEDTAEELKQQWLSKKDEIRSDLPYPEESK